VETSSHDILLIGGGGAGLRAAIAIAEADPKIDVAMVSKVYPMRSHTVSAEGGAAGVAGADDTLDEHCYDTISGSDWLGDQDAIEAFVGEIQGISSSWNIGDAPGAANPTDALRCALSAE
jgi:fumarate reductase flavoprotein subunit